MNRQGLRILISIFLIGMGILALLSNLNMLPVNLFNTQWLWMAVFGFIGIVFLGVFIGNIRDQWWAVIPGLTLIGLALLVGVPAFQGQSGGGLFLGMIGLSFLVIYLTHREFWWAIIPGGVLLTLALIAGISNPDNGMAMGGFFFLGLALTFILLYLLPNPAGRMQWALWPAGALGVMGVLILTGASGLAQFVWPLVLILFGGWMVYRAMRKRVQ